MFAQWCSMYSRSNSLLWKRKVSRLRMQGTFWPFFAEYGIQDAEKTSLTPMIVDVQVGPQAPAHELRGNLQPKAQHPGTKKGRARFAHELPTFAPSP
mmetsp:Transcript_40109/g.126868  ORF Transcript_40109/g.126868 Transcript_40109/m.126868 type:complete len:97 (-) Transcript_40109:13-303(-)